MEVFIFAESIQDVKSTVVTVKTVPAAPVSYIRSTSEN